MNGPNNLESLCLIAFQASFYVTHWLIGPIWDYKKVKCGDSYMGRAYLQQFIFLQIYEWAQ